MAGGLFGESSNGAVVDPGAFLDSEVPQHIGRLLSLGVLVSIGRSRDGGAISLTITNDGKYEREYFRHTDEAIDWLKRAYDLLTGLGLAPLASPQVTHQKPTRGARKPV